MKSSSLSINRLTPFIIIFALVIVCTIVVLNLREFTAPEKEEENFQFQEPSHEIKMYLSPFYLTPRQEQHSKENNEHSSMPDLEENMSTAYMEINHGKIVEAEERLRTLYIFYPQSPRLLSMLGNLFYAQARYADAELFFRKRAIITPDDPMVYNDLGASLAHQNKMSEAISNEKKVLELNPHSGLAPLNLSGMYAESGNTVEAIRYLKDAYEKLGERILPLLEATPQMDKLRDHEEFKLIIKDAENKKLRTENPQGEQK